MPQRNDGAGAGSVDSATRGPGRRPVETGRPLAWRLLMPLGLLAVLTCAAITALLANIISARMDAEVDARLERLAEALVSSGLLLDGDLLGRVRAVTGVEVATIGPDGALQASTLDPERARDLVSRTAAGEQVWKDPRGQTRYRAIVRPGAVLGRGAPVTLVVAASTQATDRLKRSLGWAVALVAASALFIAVVVGMVVVGSATRPVRELAAAARQVGAGALDRRVPEGGGLEISTLAREFNAMVEELGRSRAELVRSEKLAAAGRTAAGVAHELRNPLSSIRMNLQLIERDAGGRLGEDLRDVLDEMDRLDLVLGNMLDLAAPIRLRTGLHDLDDVVRGALRLTGRKLRHLGVVVEEHLAGDLPPVRFDALKIKQVLLNVILNAAEAMPGGGVLRVETRGGPQGVAAVFQDSGCGLGGAEVGRLFEPFVSTKPGGAGLGLHAVKSLMELHGGRVRLEPCSPSGARCVLEFPGDAVEPRPAVAAATGRERP